MVGRLYVLGFQGPFQYTLMGLTGNAPERMSRHILDAGRHGYALLNAWVSPVLPRAHKQAVGAGPGRAVARLQP
jgi:hypothetical protein